MAGLLTVAMGNPYGALARLERGDHQMAFAIGNILGSESHRGATCLDL